MSETYFSKFPLMVYNNTLCRDITRRVKMVTTIKKTKNYYPVEIKSGFRADLLADAYYEDPELDWLVYLANDIIDPYYNWYLNENEFNEFIKTKYGSKEQAIKKIKWYRNNWYNDETELPPSYYDNNLAKSLKKYYTPNYNSSNKVISYSRKKEDWIRNVNKILQYTVSNTIFTEGEIVDIKYSGEIVGGGEVEFSNSSILIIKNVSGNTSANSTHTKTIIGETSLSNSETSNVSTLSENISNSESVFWSPYTFFDYENELNESKKHLKVIDSAYSLEFAEQLRIKLAEDK